MDTNDPNFDEEIYAEELWQRIRKEAERVSGLPADQLIIYLSKFEPEGVIKGESPTADIEIKMNWNYISEDVNTSALEKS